MYVIVYDFGTSNLKTCLFDIDSEMRMAASSTASYKTYILENGGAEQDVDEWWQAVCSTTKKLFEKTDVTPDQVSGMAFCAQMMSVVLVDKRGEALRRPMNFMDQRAVREFEECMGKGLVKISGGNLRKIARNLKVNHGVALSVKDPVWKYKWVERNEPEVFEQVYAWLDASDYLRMRCTGKIARTPDTAFATFLYDTREGKEGWNEGLVRMYGVRPEHLPSLVECTDLVGGLTEEAARDLGLKAGTPVFGGGGDTSFSSIGAGATALGDTHIYVGTCGWVSTFLDHQKADVVNIMTGVLSAQRGYFNYYAELATAGKCFDWVKNHLALDEIGVFLEEATVADDVESKYTSLYDYLSAEVSKVPPGANGVIFTPWLQGCRCPFEDSAAAGMFFNIRLENGKRDMIRAVLEGICYHLRWMLECMSRKVKTSNPVRFVGGGALSPVTCQMLADITGRTVETIDGAQQVGAAGAALVVAAGIEGIDVLQLAKRFAKPNHSYVPNPENKAVYDRNYKVFKKLYKSNAAHFRALNRP
ncbi:FGGY-family carbohydrate kinase [Denitrobacterium detoxificans]|jgi:xylulokinase|uniref:xylulokinase n=1 Tax=Denitrobacterium detoxificans TaxID=79604 RepID=UPI0026EA38B4|nr:FGGY-family carbohydrate kinase [Denitrobacterium detoxificans]MBE6466444.1 carbohydrate kinase [Denitrobacterium detoxificans]